MGLKDAGYVTLLSVTKYIQHDTQTHISFHIHK